MRPLAFRLVRSQRAYAEKMVNDPSEERFIRFGMIDPLPFPEPG
jgi:hypothetical protein